MHVRNLTLKAAFAAVAVGLLAAPAAFAQHKLLTWKDAWYTKVNGPENDFDARSGYEAGNLAFPANGVGAGEQSTAAAAALRLFQASPASTQSWHLLGPIVGNAPGPVLSITHNFFF